MPERYPYISFWQGNYMVKKPLIEVELLHKDESMKQLALLDSGADITTINAEIAKYLGIDLKECEERVIAGVVGQPATAYLTEMDMRVTGFPETLRFRVLFVPNLKMNILLGQEGFFDAFRVSFLKTEDTIELSRANEGN
jgi:hypothetical protein